MIHEGDTQQPQENPEAKDETFEGMESIFSDPIEEDEQFPSKIHFDIHAQDNVLTNELQFTLLAKDDTVKTDEVEYNGGKNSLDLNEKLPMNSTDVSVNTDQWFDEVEDVVDSFAPPPEGVDAVVIDAEDFNFDSPVRVPEVTKYNYRKNSLDNYSSTSSSDDRSDVSSTSDESDFSVVSSDQEVIGNRSPRRKRPRVSRAPVKKKKFAKPKKVTKLQVVLPLFFPSPKQFNDNNGEYFNPPIQYDVFCNVSPSNTEFATLKGKYSFNNINRATFTGYWGFSEEDFQAGESSGRVSKFEYSASHVRKDALLSPTGVFTPISGRYTGYFNFRQFHGKILRIPEQGMCLYFQQLPSLGETDSMAGLKYEVLGSGKNRFGRFLLRGYLNPITGNMTVRRKYLE